MKQGHVVHSSAVQQMVAAGNPTFWRPSITTNMARPPLLFPDHSQPLLGGLVVGEEDNKPDLRKLEQQFLSQTSNSSMCGHVENFQLSPSCFRNNMLNFSPDPDASSKCNNDVGVTGGVAKKPRSNQQSSASHSTLKVKKEKLGDRITALHQLVSPFGKTDTASVLLEAIGYIKFLERQIESQTRPYLCSGSQNNSQQHHVQGERNCLSDSGQGLDEELPKVLRSRGLCLVPICCTLDVGNENIGADYWAPAFGTNYFG